MSVGLTRLRPQRVERLLGIAVLVVVGGFILSQLQVHLLLRDTTPNGGDTGAHVWWPAFMRDHVFPKLQLSGWAPDWYAGFPVGHFYFPLPALLIVLLDVVIPYNVAFKLVTALGPVLIPVGAYVLARGLRAPWPAPPLFALATLPFLFFTPAEHNFRIMGGNLPSTLAGEFSYAIALGLGLCFLGTLARALDEGRRLWLPAVLLAATVLTHGIVTVFVAVGGVVIWLARGPVRRLRAAVAIAAVALLLTAIWTLPLVPRVAYMTDMGWAKVTEYKTYLLHGDLSWVLILGGVALIAGAAYLRRATMELAALAAVFALLFRFVPEGRLWNLRLLPFFHLMVFLLAAMGVAELVNLVRRLLDLSASGGLRAEAGAVDVSPSPARARDDERPPPPRALPGTVFAHVAVVVALAAMLAFVSRDSIKEFIPAWAKWNNSGYEAASKAAYPEYQAIMDTLDALPGGDFQRLMWERLNKINDYGSDLALELIPYFTESKVGSMEGLYFESAGTTPYHFLTVADMAAEPSNPVRDLNYGSINSNFDRGVQRLQMLGVNYFLAGSDAAKQQASQHPGLRFRVEIGNAAVEPKVARWAVYDVLDAPLVAPLAYEPVVVEDGERPGLSPTSWVVDPREWMEVAADWFDDPANWSRHWAWAGPPEWDRVRAADAKYQRLGTEYPDVEVTDVEIDDDTVRFRVDRTGVPVLVKVSYFPNWHVRGADGPWRVTPNFMVVTPTDHEVELHYGRRSVDRLGLALTLLGVVGVVGLARWRPLRSEDGPDEAT